MDEVALIFTSLGRLISNSEILRFIFRRCLLALVASAPVSTSSFTSDLVTSGVGVTGGAGGVCVRVWSLRVYSALQRFVLSVSMTLVNVAMLSLMLAR